MGKKVKENGDDVEQEKWGEKRRHYEQTWEIRSNNYHSEDGVYTHNTSDKDEGPRPGKRRQKLRSDPIKTIKYWN